MATARGTDKISVALVCVSMNQLGGKNVHLRDLFLNLDPARFTVYLVCTSSIENSLKQAFTENGIPKERIIFLPRALKWTMFPYIFRLARIFREKKINIVHTFQIESDIFGALAAKLTGVPVLISIMESKVMPENIGFTKKLFYYLVNLFMKNWFFKTIAVSEGLRRELIEEHFRPAEKVRVIHLGIHMPDAYKDRDWSFARLSRGAPVIGTIGRLSWEKGLERFVRAMPLILQEMSQASFLIVGSGPEENKLKQLVKDDGLSSRVIFKPWTDNVWQELESLDIFVMPSLREGCPHILLEALYLSKPVVASNIEGISDIIDEGESGLLVDTLNARLFAEKIISLCRDPIRASLLGKNGRRKILDYFTIQREIKQITALYTRSLKFIYQQDAARTTDAVALQNNVVDKERDRVRL
ncbi:MAG: glycosyltransferase [Planctomycetes bacterium]|nr:glycosyltransferase [Planctomycetota bacterium]